MTFFLISLRKMSFCIKINIIVFGFITYLYNTHYKIDKMNNPYTGDNDPVRRHPDHHNKSNTHKYSFRFHNTYFGLSAMQNVTGSKKKAVT